MVGGELSRGDYGGGDFGSRGVFTAGSIAAGSFFRGEFVRGEYAAGTVAAGTFVAGSGPRTSVANPKLLHRNIKNMTNIFVIIKIFSLLQLVFLSPTSISFST